MASVRGRQCGLERCWRFDIATEYRYLCGLLSFESNLTGVFIEFVLIFRGPSYFLPYAVDFVDTAGVCT